MNVVQLLYSGLGGHGSVAFSLIEGDKCNRWNPALGFLGIEPLREEYKEQCLNREIPHTYFEAVPGRPTRTWPSIFQWLRIQQPDAILVHSPAALFPSLLYTLWKDSRLVFVEHLPTELRTSSRWFLSASAMQLADRVVLLTPQYREWMKKEMGILFRRKRVKVIPNGVDTSVYAPLSYNDSPKRGATSKIRLGMAARFTSKKRQDVLVDMMAHLQETTDVDWTLSLAGDGSTWDGISEQVEARGLSDVVELPGMLGEDELVDWYKTIDIYLHASDGETLSTSLIQAMSCELPIVGSDVGGIANIVDGKSRCGMVVPNEPSAFAEAVMKLKRESSLAEKLSKAARKEAVSRYSNEAMFRAYHQAITSSL